MRVINFIIKMIVGAVVKGTLKNQMQAIARIPDKVMQKMEEKKQKQNMATSVIMQTGSALATIAAVVLFATIAAIAYLGAETIFPAKIMEAFLIIVKKKSVFMPMSFFMTMLTALLLSKVDKNTKKELLQKTSSVLKSLLSGKITMVQVKELGTLYKDTIILWVKTKSNDWKCFCNAFQDKPYDLILFLVLMASASIFALCMSMATVAMWEGTSTVEEITTGFLILIFGLAIVLNYVRIQDTEREVRND